MRKFLMPLTILMMLNACQNQKESADLIVTGGRIYTLDSGFSIAEALVVKDGRILATGSSENILAKYHAGVILSLDGKIVYPGFIDAHCHFLGLGEGMVRWANLRGARSMDEIIERLKVFAGTYPQEWVLGRGWDQNLFDGQKFPDNTLLDKHFPGVPVLLVRVDGHAALASPAAMATAGLYAGISIPGGEIRTENGKPTGLVLEKAKEHIMQFVPPADDKLLEQALQTAERTCFGLGITGVCDAGLNHRKISLIRQLQDEKRLKMPMAIMLDPDNESLTEIMAKGILKTDRLIVNAVKLYADGALGSRGALLLEPYSDNPSGSGILVNEPAFMQNVMEQAYAAGYQVCTHAIGDSANRMILRMYAGILKGRNDKRWRIEHAQVVHPEDMPKFGSYSIIPSVQPTHASSDMPWAGDRLGSARIAHAYAYRELLSQNGWMPLGTDFPIEEVDPMLTFYAAVFRKDSTGKPDGGFMPENAITRKDALLGMTLWAAKGSFLEKETGSLEPGKWADFIVLDQDLMEISEQDILKTKILQTRVHGEIVYTQP